MFAEKFKEELVEISKVLKRNLEKREQMIANLYMVDNRELRNRSTPGKSGHERNSREPHGVKRGQAASWDARSGGRYKMQHTESYKHSQNLSSNPLNTLTRNYFSSRKTVYWVSKLTLTTQ